MSRIKINGTFFDNSTENSAEKKAPPTQIKNPVPFEDIVDDTPVSKEEYDNFCKQQVGLFGNDKGVEILKTTLGTNKFEIITDDSTVGYHSGRVFYMRDKDETRKGKSKEEQMKDLQKENFFHIPMKKEGEYLSIYYTDEATGKKMILNDRKKRKRPKKLMNREKEPPKKRRKKKPTKKIGIETFDDLSFILTYWIYLTCINLFSFNKDPKIHKTTKSDVQQQYKDKVVEFDNYRTKIQTAVEYNEKKYEILFMIEKVFLKRVIYKYVKGLSKEDPNTKSWKMIKDAVKKVPWNFQDAFPVYEKIRDHVAKQYMDKMKEFQEEYKTVLARNKLVISKNDVVK